MIMQRKPTLTADIIFWHKIRKRHTLLFDFNGFFTDLLNSFGVIEENKGEHTKSVTKEDRFLHNISNLLFIVALNYIVLQLFLVLPLPLQIC